ncbi:DUF2817 domain-containing protein [bacterium]|nr:DUF2817 domain-containing protein [bacterium]
MEGQQNDQSRERDVAIGCALLVTAAAVITAVAFPSALPPQASFNDRENRLLDSQAARDTGSTGSDSRLAPLLVQREQLGLSARGEPIDLVRIGDGPIPILILASIHGNESAGTALLIRLERELQRFPELVDERSVFLIPMANPDGVALNQRFNANGIDLNRNFPADNRQNSLRFGREALSEPEARAIHGAIEAFAPSHIVTLHEPLTCVDYDGPAESLASAMSDVCPLPVRKLGSRPGSLGSYAGLTLGIPIVTFELPRNARDLNDDQLWALYGSALIAAVRWQPTAIPVTALPVTP